MWQAALILPLYFLADATITLVRRALRGEPVWQAHRTHFYQRAVLVGMSHAAVVSGDRRESGVDRLCLGGRERVWRGGIGGGERGCRDPATCARAAALYPGA